MNHLYSYKFRLYPTRNQEVLLSKHFGSCRFIYNYFLEQRIGEYKENNITLSRFDNQSEIPQLKKELNWLKEVGSQSLQYSICCLQSAYDHFFRRCKERKQGSKVKPGFPVFKKKHDKQSFKILQNIKITNNKLVIPKFLEGIPIVLHRELEGEIRYATISKTKSNEYYVSITVKRDIQFLPRNTNSIGIDLNVVDVVDNNGNNYFNPRPGFRHKNRFRLLHKAVSRCENNSKGKGKTCKKLAKLYKYCHDVREDFLHKLSRKLINDNQVICIEDLSVQSMLATDDKEPKWKQKRLHRDLQDCAFYSLRQKLEYKAQWYGRQLVKVSRWFPSSQICNQCGWRYHNLPKGYKEWCCYGCFGWNDRNTNSAKNIHDEGLKILTIGTMGLADCPDVRLTQCEQLVGSEAAIL